MVTKYNILGVPIHNLSYKEVETLLTGWLTEGGAVFHQVVTTNPEFVMQAQKNGNFKAVLQTAALSLVDGFGILCASLFLYGKTVERITGVRATLLLCELAQKYEKNVFLLGGLAGVAEKCAEELMRKFPQLKIVGAIEGIPFTDYGLSARGGPASGGQTTNSQDDLNKSICEEINRSQADILLVAYGAPKQELWISQHKLKLPNVCIAMGVGGTFDYLSGVIPYCPPFFRSLGLEWFFRLFVEPKRIKRIITAVICFPAAVFWYKLKSIVN